MKELVEDDAEGPQVNAGGGGRVRVGVERVRVGVERWQKGSGSIAACERSRRQGCHRCHEHNLWVYGFSCTSSGAMYKGVPCAAASAQKRESNNKPR